MKLGQRMSEEQKVRMSVTLKGNGKGIAKSAEQRARMSEVKMGHVYWGLEHHTAETKEKMSVAKIGHVFWGLSYYTPEMCAKISVAKMGNTYRLGCSMPLETRAKISKATTGALNWRWQGGITLEKMRGYKRKSSFKRRGLGNIYLNSWFIGCDGHHINLSDVIYIPKAMHDSVRHNIWTGKNMDKINALAGQYLTEDWT